MDRDEMVRLIDRYAANVGEFILLNLPESCIERQMTGDLKEIEQRCTLYRMPEEYESLARYYKRTCNAYRGDDEE